MAVFNGIRTREAIRHLQAPDSQFEPTYCLTSEWTAWMDRPTMVQVLRRSGLGVVAENFHSRWETGSSLLLSNQQSSIENWLELNPEHKVPWAAIMSEGHHMCALSGRTFGGKNLVMCVPDVGLTEFETGSLRDEQIEQRQRETQDAATKFE